MAPGTLEVLHLVPPLVELADPVQPPIDVAAPVRTRQPYVLADRDRDVAARSSQLVRDLDPGCRRTHHQDAAVVVDLRRSPVGQRGELLHGLREVRGEAPGHEARSTRPWRRRPRRSARSRSVVRTSKPVPV